MTIHRHDFLVIGSGIAGLKAAYELSFSGSVAIITKRAAADSNTDLAQGGIAAAMGKDDSPSLHEADTLEAGAGLCDPETVRVTVTEGPARIRELVKLGVRFTKKNKKYDLGLEGAHSRRRVLHYADMTGHEVVRALLSACHLRKNITFFERHAAVDLILDSHPSRTRPEKNFCFGVYVLEERTGLVHSFYAKKTIIASGGAGKVYRYTSNPDTATGDGMAIAYRAGLKLADMEFVQFHPTYLFHPQTRSLLISEALRGEGGILKLSDGNPFMEKYTPLKELAPRDVVARAIDNELKRTGEDCVYLDVSHLSGTFIRRRFPNIYGKCLSLGIDITRSPIPVVPAAHFFCGGIATDICGRTAMKGLYAAGEAARTGLHGANRLASNSLLEGCVFGHRAANAMKNDPPTKRPPAPEVWNYGNARPGDEAVIITHNWDEIRTLMWNYVGIVRSDKRLERAKARSAIIGEEIQRYYWDFLLTRDLLELRNISCLADVIIRAAAARKESRGLHYNINYPAPQEALRKSAAIDRYSNI